MAGKTTLQQAFRQMRQIERVLTEEWLAVRSNQPIIRGSDLVWADFSDISFVLKNQPYTDLHKECLRLKAYSFLMLDMGLVQMMYRFDARGEEILEHRLAFFPEPWDFPPYEDDPNFFESVDYEEHFSESMANKFPYPHMLPIRFDFSNSAPCIEHYHSAAHCTLWMQKNVRIPLAGPLWPAEFIKLVLRNFYRNKSEKIEDKLNAWSDILSSKTITDQESKEVHFSIHRLR